MSLPEIKLIDGRTAKFIRRPTAGDVSRAHRNAGKNGSVVDINCALFAQIVEVDGQRNVMEDFLRWLDWDDYLELLDIINSGRWNGESNKRPDQENTYDNGEYAGNF